MAEDNLIMLGKTFLKIVCVSALGAGALVSGATQSFSQSSSRLENPRYGLHRRPEKAKKDEKSESGLSFSVKELVKWEVMQERITLKYEQRVRDVFSGKISFDQIVTALRTLYPKTFYYDPFSKSTIDKMTAYAYTADVSDDQEEVNEALDAYRDLLFKHVANMEVVEYALTLSRVNPMYGDKLRLKRIYDAFIVGMKRFEEKGTSPDDSYKIVTFGEETYLLGMHNVTVEKSEIYKVGNMFYNVHDVIYKDGRHSQIYVDVTWPIYMYEKTKAVHEREARRAIPLQ